MQATESSWKHSPPPVEKEALGFEAEFSNAEIELIELGFIPRQMEDKWFIYFADGCLRFHRSWSGAFIYSLRLEQAAGVVRVVESWVNRSKDYNGGVLDYERRVVRFLIDSLLLKKSGMDFPLPPGLPQSHQGPFQHAVVGQTNPDTKSDTSG